MRNRAGYPETRRPVLCAVDRPATELVVRPYALLAAHALGTAVHDVHFAPLPAGGGAGPAIVEEARRQHSGLVVMGSRALSDARALLAGGSVAHDVIRGAPCPVLVVPLESRVAPPLGGFERILVAIDGSESANRAVEAAADLAARGAEVVVLHCREVEVMVATLVGAALGGSGEGSWPLETPAEADVLAESFAEALRARGLRARACVYSAEHAQVASRIAQEAAQLDAQVVAMGTRGRSGVASLLLGSVAHAVLASGHRPLLVAR